MKVMCVFDRWWPKVHPEVGETYHVAGVHYFEGEINAYDLQEFPDHAPYRWALWYLGPGRRLCRAFIDIEDLEFADEIIEQLTIDQEMVTL